jgi:hypothetical protein
VITDPISIAGVAGPVVVDTSPFLGLRAVRVGGLPAQRIGRGTYALPSLSGGAIHARVRASFADPYPTVEVNGVRHRTGPVVPLALRVLALLPIALVAIGGLLGGVVGALASVANVAVARTPIPAIVKALIMLVVGVVAFVVLVLLATALRIAIS